MKIPWVEKSSSSGENIGCSVPATSVFTDKGSIAGIDKEGGTILRPGITFEETDLSDFEDKLSI